MTDEQAHLVQLTEGWSLWRPVALRSAGLPIDLLRPLAMPDLLADPPSQQRSAAIRSASSAAVAGLLSDDRFTEAVRWQNPNVAGTWLGEQAARLAAGDQPKLANRAYRESVVARYAQRYCAKNESIGFFGPVAWARFEPADSGLRQHGGGGIRRRTAFLETWAMAALGQAWSRDSRLFPHLPVRLDPATTFAAGVLRRPQRAPEHCDAQTSALLSAVEQCGRVGAVLAASGAAPDALLQLHARGIVQLGFLVPFQARPDEQLRRQLADLPAGAARDELLGILDELLALRDATAAARGPAAVSLALDKLTDHLVKAGCAGAAEARRSTHARTAVYLDCRRDTDVGIGADLLDAIRAPLGITLDCASWLAAEVAEAVSAGLRERYRWLVPRRTPVTLSDLQFAAADILSGEQIAADIASDFHQRWAEILPSCPGQQVQLRSAEIRPLVDALFPAAPVRWAAGRYHSPDLLICQEADGSMRWVLGELHVALNTLESRLFVTQCDDPAELVRATATDLRGGRVVPSYPLTAPQATGRTHPPSALDPPGLYKYWSYGSDQGHPDGAQTVPGTAITVAEVDGELIGYASAQGWSAPVLEFFGDFLTAVAVNLFRLRPNATHLPRLLIDDVVIARQSWSIPASQLPLPSRNTQDRGYQRVRDWAADLGLPRHVFVQTPVERKPFYVDFAAPLLVANLVRAVRRAHEAGPLDLTMTEMLPGPDQLWLTDSAGRRYTAEFRVVAVCDQGSEPAI